MLKRTVNAIQAAIDAQLAVFDSEEARTEKARAAAKQLWNAELQCDTGEQFKDQIKEWKAEARKVVTMPDTAKAAKGWDHLWTYIGTAYLILMRPDEPVQIGDQAPVAAKTCSGHATSERLANRAIREALGIANKRQPQAPAAPKIDTVAASQQAFEVDAKHVRELLDRVLGMQSGFGLLADALKAKGFTVVKAEVVAELPAPEPAPEPVPPPKAKRSRSKAAARQ